ncbi:hypothetical protein KOAAANKH_02679 [Brevundimonas sp. NIBR10]|uniref:calcium-binding protein n=1 Tax=Brevundimonas sp. NIBR10 TaxID=3015997 RepID=UPI0022F15949|nr:calcium-binding protein [Brevundimonas sp. NIBR10]WGM47794.1 hypothetical protein KOAAANKH_02679 [Brevundimonas sp. NIBR10]
MPTFTGTAGDDTLTGGVGEDIVLGLDGNDTLSTGEVYIAEPTTPLPVTNVRDVVRGGAGNDVITASGINNGTMLSGDDGDDRITADFPGVAAPYRVFPGGNPITSTVYTGVDGDPIQIFGGAGNDQIRARGHAIIDGGDGDDYITVGLGYYWLLGGPGFYSVPSGQDRTIRVTGGAGADVFNIENPVGAVLITDFEVGVDRLNLHNSNPNLQGFGHNGYIIMARQGSDTLLLSRDGSRVFARLTNVDPATLTASTFLENPGGPGFIAPATYLDLSGPIYTAGTDQADTIQGVGASFMFGQGGNDVLRAGTGNSILSGDAGDDRLVGADGADTLRGGVGADTLEGGAGGDTLLGGDGSDVMIGGLGADVLTGGEGRDTYRYTSAAESNATNGYDILTDFQDDYALSGNGDRVDLTGLGASQVTLLRTGSFETVLFATTGDGVLQVGSSGRLSGSDLILAAGATVTMIGSTQGDFLIGGSGADTLYGLDGGDNLQGRGGADVLFGGAGADRFTYALASDSTASAYDTIVDFETGIDRIDYFGDPLAFTVTAVTIVRSAGSSFVFSESSLGSSQVLALGRDVNAGDVYRTGSLFRNVTLIGSEAQDTLIGGTGDDVLRGGRGLDQLTGGAGADSFVYAAGDSTQTAIDSIADFQTGSDRIVLEGTVTGLSLVRVSSTATLVFAGHGAEPQTVIGVNGVIQGGDVVGANGAAMRTSLVGSSGADLMIGGGLDDTLTGDGGADSLAGGAGADVFRYTSAADSNAAGADNLYDFQTGIDLINVSGPTTTAISIIRSDNGSSFVSVETTEGSMLITAAGRAINGTDFRYGNQHGIYLIGSSGADVLTGSSLADPIQGGAGNDTITGGGGADVLFGEGGADTFVYRAASDSTVAAADTIFGFVSGTDRLDLSAVRTGASDTYGIAYANGGSFLFVDLGGNGTNDMLIQLAGTTLVASDIRWSASAGELEPTVKDAGPDVLPVSDDGDLGLSGLGAMDGGEMRFLADGALASARGHDWYL